MQKKCSIRHRVEHFFLFYRICFSHRRYYRFVQTEVSDIVIFIPKNYAVQAQKV